MKRLTTLSISLLLCLIAWAQQTYRGRVVDAETGEPLPYASIKGDSLVAMANADGVFAIDARNERSLTISAIGYSSRSIEAGAIGDTVRLQPLRIVQPEAQDGTAETILRKLAKMMAKEFKHYARTKSVYFTRQTSCFEQWMETCEDIQLSECALNIGSTISMGKNIYRVDPHEYDMRLPYSDLQHLTELGASTVESSFWKYTEKPLRLKMIKEISSYDPFPSSRTLSGANYRLYAGIDEMSFNYSYEMLQDAQGQEVAKIYARVSPDVWNIQKLIEILENSDEAILMKGKKGKRVRIKNKEELLKWTKNPKMMSLFVVRNKYGTEVRLQDALQPDAFPIIDGVVWVDAKNNQLLAFQGTLHNFSLSFVYHGKREKVMADVKVDITYTHRNKFTEVENVVVHVNAEGLVSRTLLCNLYLNSKAERKGISKQAKETTSMESLSSLPQPVLRTDAEKRIIHGAKAN